MLPLQQQYSYLAFFVHGVSKESEAGRSGGRKAAPPPLGERRRLPR